MAIKRDGNTWYNDKNVEHIIHTPDAKVPQTAEGLYVLARIGNRFMCVDRQDYVYNFLSLLDGHGPRYMQTLARRVRKDIKTDAENGGE